MSVRVKSADEIALMRAAGKILAKSTSGSGACLKTGNVNQRDRPARRVK